MATIGLDNLYYAMITEDASGNETYGTPKKLAKAMTAELSVEYAEANLYADDRLAETVKEFKSGKLTTGIDDLSREALIDLAGAVVDENGVLIAASENGGQPVAVGFRAKKANGKYRYFWVYRVKFAVPSTSLQTKGDSVTFSTPSIEGVVSARNKVDAYGNHPWKAEVTEGDSGVSASTISGWFTSVYEASAPAAELSSLSIGSLTLNPTFAAATTTYTATTSNAKDAVTATAATGVSVTITANGTAIQSGAEVTWETGSNTVVITVDNHAATGNTKTYTVTVTKS